MVQPAEIIRQAVEIFCRLPVSYHFSTVLRAVFSGNSDAQVAFQAHIALQAEAVALAGEILLAGFLLHHGNELREPRVLRQARQIGGQVDDNAVYAVGQLD